MPTRTTTDLLDKFATVALSEQKLPISDDDLKYCELLQAQYDACIAKLDEIEAETLVLHEKYPHPYIKIEPKNHASEYREVKKPHSWDIRKELKSPFEQYTPSFDYMLVWLRNTRILSAHRLITEITSYFEGQYQLKLTQQDILIFRKGRTEEKPNYQAVVRDIIKECGGKSLVDMGIDRMIDLFGDEVRYREKYSVSNKKLTLANFFWFEEGYWGYKWKNDDTRRAEKLATALTYFETGKLDNIMKGFGRYDSPIEFTETYEPDFLKLVSGIKVFKNGRVDIVFTTKDAPHNFITKLKLNELKLNNRE